MATRQRLRELMYADIKRECQLFNQLSSNVTTRTATPEELQKYKNITSHSKERLHKEFNRKVR